MHRPTHRAARTLACTIAALCIPGCATTRTTAAQPAITAGRLHAELDRYICAEWSPEVQEWGGPLFDERCPQPLAATELERAAQAASLRLRPLHMLSAAAGERLELALRGLPGTAQPTADARAREQFWRDPTLSRAATLALRAELDARGWRCEDCPSVAAATPLELRWSAFLPYLGAYLWPHDGEHGRVEIHTCSGINGALALTPDERLLQAGVLVAFSFAIDPAMAEQIHDIAATSSSTPEAVQRLQVLLDAPPGRAHACTALTSLAWYTGLQLHECPRGLLTPHG